MESPVYILLVCVAVLSQDVSAQHQHTTPEAQKRSSASYSTSVVHDDGKEGQTAQSSINVNFHSIPDSTTLQLQPTKTSFVYSQPLDQQINQESADSHIGTFSPNVEKQIQQIYGQDAASHYQQLQQQLASQNREVLHTANLQPDLYAQSSLQPQSSKLYNVGYSINIENSAPKLMYRLPNPQRNAPSYSYRQQKLLNADVITGTNKDIVEKPLNYLNPGQGKELQTAASFQQGDVQSLTKVYSNVKNTHGYTWKTLSPGVEISGYHSLDGGPLSNDQQVQAQHFDHAAALGRSQGFDISNVVETGRQSYQQSPAKFSASSHALNINQGLAAAATNSHLQDFSGLTSSHGLDTNSGSSGSLDTSTLAEIANEKLIANAQSAGNKPSLDTSSLTLGSKLYSGGNYGTVKSLPSFDFGSGLKSSDFNLQGGPYQSDLFSLSSLDVDKSLFDNIYKNYNPFFYQHDVTLPSPKISSSINLNSYNFPKRYAPTQLPSFNLGHLQAQPNPQSMINQHYAFVQAENLNHQLPLTISQPLNSDVKPVQEPPEDSHGQASTQQLVVQTPETSKELKGGRKKYFPQTSSAVVRPYSPRSVLLVNDKNYRLKTNLRPPPPMIIVHQKY